MAYVISTGDFLMIKHNKQKNVGIIFEALICSVINNTINKEENKARRIFSVIKESFSANKTELNKAHKVYSQLLYNESRNVYFASKMIGYLIEEAARIDEGKLNTEINLLFESIADIVNKKALLNNKVSNFKLYASFKSLVENFRNDYKTLSSKDRVLCENVIIDHFINNSENKSLKSQVQEISGDDLRTRELTTVFAVKNFHKKYDGDLNEEQKIALKKYFTSKSDKEFSKWVGNKIKNINNIIENKLPVINDTSMKAKMETVKIKLSDIANNKTITTEGFENLLLAMNLKEKLMEI